MSDDKKSTRQFRQDAQQSPRHQKVSKAQNVTDSQQSPAATLSPGQTRRASMHPQTAQREQELDELNELILAQGSDPDLGDEDA